MSKFQADIYLKSIEYTGETIGREFAIKIKINRKTKRQDYRVTLNISRLVM